MAHAVFVAEGGQANGLDSDLGGLLLTAEHANRRVSRTLANATVVTVVSEHMGDRLNSPNDIAVRSDGTIYFTDPPNGLVLSPDESVLYVADSTAGVMAFDVNADGSLSNERDFIETLPNADGMAIDMGGNLFVTTSTGVQVFDPAGNSWGTIEVSESRRVRRRRPRRRPARRCARIAGRDRNRA
ncbi:MAG: SMP-30/gluconolactonase/LRE family protein [Polyangiales bacterium]